MPFLRLRPIRFDILTASTVLLFLSVITIVAYVYYMNSSAVLGLSRELMDRVRYHVASEADNFVRPAGPILRIAAGMAAEEGLSLPNNVTLRNYALGVLESYPGVVAVLMADPEGNFLMANRSELGRPALKTIDVSGGSAVTRWQAADKSGVWRTVEDPDDKGGFDPRTRPWYLGALKTGGVFWTDAYIFHTGKVPGLTASLKVTDARGRLLGVVGIDVTLDLLSNFLAGLEVGKNGVAFVINHKGEIVAFPGAAPLLHENDNKQTHGLVTLDKTRFAWVDAFGKELEKGDGKDLVYEHDGKRYLGTVAHFPATFAKDWRIAVIVPEDDFIGPLKETGMHSLLFTLGVLILSLGLGVLLANAIARPITILTGETKRIMNFQLDGQSRTDSRIREIHEMQDAFAGMKNSLVTFTKFAPEEVVRQVVAQGGEALLAGEKREVTVLFCDLRGFTGFAERTAAEEVVRILNAHFDVMVRIINRHRGFVCDFLGDSVFAVFGAPEPDPEHARRAVECALQMQLARRRLDRDTAELGMPPLEMGIGINSGLTVVGNMGSQLRIKYGVVGHAVNLGARIESFSVGGQVLISESTHRAVSELFATRGPHAVEGKGVGEPIHLWEVRASLEHPETALPPTVEGLADLPRPLEAGLRLVVGKTVEAELFAAWVDRLSGGGLEARTPAVLGMFATVQITLAEGLVVDARVVGLPEEGGAVLKFSGLSREQARRVGELLVGLVGGTA